MNYDEMLDVAARAARQAGQYALGQMGQVEAELKDEDQLVTAVDRACQEMIFEAIESRWPAHGLMGEECANGGLYKREPVGDADVWWVVDPVDGTRNYAHGVGLFGVSIGVLVDGMPVLGVIYDPSRDVMYSGYEGERSLCNGRSLRCWEGVMDVNTQLAMPGQHPEGVPDSVAALMSRHNCMSLGSAALHLGYVASGGYAAMCSWKVRLWDIVGGAAIVTGAGGVMSDLSGGARFPVDCRGYDGQALEIVIGSKVGCEEILKYLAAGAR